MATPLAYLENQDNAQAGFAEQSLRAATECLPAMRALLRSQPETSVGDYVRHLVTNPARPVQPRDDLVERVRRACVAPLGEGGAEEAAAALEARPAVLTAHHQGVDYFAQSVQSTLALAAEIARGPGAGRGATVVLACAGVPLNNLTYPRGLLMYSGQAVRGGAAPRRLPVFPDSRKRELVALTRGFDAEMVARAVGRLGRMAEAGEVPGSVARAARLVLEEDYADARVLGAATYSEQATLVNARIWERLFEQPEAWPRLAYLELEKLAAELLCEDVANTSSLAWAVLFDAPLRTAVYAALDRARGCWDDQALAARTGDAERARGAGSRGGTAFFWGVDAGSRRVPLRLKVDSRGVARLVGVSDSGESLEFILNPVTLADALRNRRLIPSLFTSYLCICLARGVTCLGGYYQAEYLPTMQAGLVRALRATTGNESLARAIVCVPTDGYLSGMQSVMCPDGAGGLVPAGPLEIIAAGGLTGADVERMAGMSVYEAHLGSTVDTVTDAARDLITDAGWGERIAADLGLRLGGSAVVKAH